MSIITDGADALYALVERDRTLILLADALKELGSLEQAAAERQQGLAEVTAKHDSAKAVLLDTLNDLNAARATQASELAAHTAAVKSAIDAANAQADTILASARDAALTVAAAARAEVQRIQTIQAEALRQGNEQLAALRTQIDGATSALQDLTAQQSDVSAAITAMKQAAQSVLG